MFFRQHIWHLAMVKCHRPLQRVKHNIVIFTMVGHVFMIEVRLSFDEPFSSPLSFLSPDLKICTSPFKNQLCPPSCISINFGYHFFLLLFFFAFNAFFTFFFFNFVPKHFISFNPVWSSFFWLLFFQFYFSSFYFI